MYPNLYFALQDLTGLELPFLKLVNSFGFFVAMAFLIGGYFIRLEFIRLTKSGVFTPNKIQSLQGLPATPIEIISQAFIGFIFGWKFLYLAINAGTLFSGGSLPQTHLFSSEGSIPLGIILAILLGGWRYYEGRKNALPEPRMETTEVAPSEHVGGILTVAAIG
ncbi:MAG: hypothetical protein P8L80_05425, partial [Flavobacteriales bacterium]|nr:hypothetical protein [Flavobacteriales bacterium]